jgi:hypothetical protein
MENFPGKVSSTVCDCGLHIVDNMRTLETSAAMELLGLFGCLPLALKQAGSYILVRKLSFNQYLDRYRKNRSSILSEYVPEAVHGDRQRHATIYTTWESSFSAVKEENLMAAELLQLSAFMASNDMRANTVRLGYGLLDDGKLAGYLPPCRSCV